MCLIIKRSKHKATRTGLRTPRIARKAIMVYKLLAETPSGRLVSPYQFMQYRKHEMLCAELGHEYSGDEPAIYEGLHAYVSPEAAFERLLYVQSFSPTANVYQVTIPKGSQYFLGCRGDIVSNFLVTGNLKLVKRRGR